MKHSWSTRILTGAIILLGGVIGTACSPATSEPPISQEPSTCFLADFAGEVRELEPRADGIRHLDTPATIAKLQELHVQVYAYLIWHAPTDWDDLAEFLPAAKNAGIDVWLYLAPPSGCDKACSDPFGIDFVRWAQEIAKLSLDHSNLKGWQIDDFDDNLGVFNTQYLSIMREVATNVNANLQFVPVVYNRSMTPSFVQSYGPLVDGICLAYRDDPYRNTQRTDSLAAQLATASDLLVPMKKPLYLMVYADALSRTPMAPRAAYVDEVMNVGLQAMRGGTVAGIITYNLRKDGKPDAPTSNIAHGGVGHYTLGVPAGVTTQPSARGGISQTVTVDQNASVRTLSFWHKDPLIDPAEMGRAHLELLVDGQVAWQEDLAVSSSPDWIQTQVDLQPVLIGATSAKITFDLVDDDLVNSSFILVRLDDITAEGLTLQNGDVEAVDVWQFSADHPAVLGAIDFFNGNRPLDIFDAVKKNYGGFVCE